MPNPRYKSNPRTPKDERTRFDKWLDQSIVDKQRIWFVLYDSEEISCLVVQVDRYMVQVDVSEDGEKPELTWINKGAMLKVAFDEDDS